MTTVAQEGRRFYLQGLPFEAKDRAKALGCKFDWDRKCWWTGKRDVADQVAGEAAAKAEARAAVAGEPKVAIGGNTYPVRDQLRDLGGAWDAGRKSWMVPESQAAKARELVAGAPKRSFRRGGQRRRGTWTGCRCGSVEEYSKPSDCWTCQHDA